MKRESNEVARTAASGSHRCSVSTRDVAERSHTSAPRERGGYTCRVRESYEPVQWTVLSNAKAATALGSIDPRFRRILEIAKRIRRETDLSERTAALRHAL